MIYKIKTNICPKTVDFVPNLCYNKHSSEVALNEKAEYLKFNKIPC